MDELFTRAGAVVPRGVLRRRWRGSVRVIRSPWRRAAGWSPEEAAAELHSRRAELIGQLRRRSEARGVPPAAQEEIVDDVDDAKNPQPPTGRTRPGQRWGLRAKTNPLRPPRPVRRSAGLTRQTATL